MQTQQTVNQNYSIPYSKDEVIRAIRGVIASSPNYLRANFNESFGSIRFFISKFVGSLQVSLILKEESETKTSIDVSLSPAVGSAIRGATMISYFSDFLDLLNRQLRGQTSTGEEPIGAAAFLATLKPRKNPSEKTYRNRRIGLVVILIIIFVYIIVNVYGT